MRTFNFNHIKSRHSRQLAELDIARKYSPSEAWHEEMSFKLFCRTLNSGLSDADIICHYNGVCERIAFSENSDYRVFLGYTHDKRRY